MATVLGLSGKVAIVTGATSGIGWAIALAFAKEGIYLTVTGRNEEALREIAKKCHECGIPQDKILSVQGDIAEEATCEKLVSLTVSHFGKLDILVNNAGIATISYLENLKMEDYDQIFRVNTRAVVVLTKLAMPYLVQSKGNVVNITTTCAHRMYPEFLPYSMSKAALEMFTRCVAKEYAEKGVRVNSVAPAYIYTDIFRRVGIPVEKLDETMEKYGAVHAMKRCGQPEEVAKSVLFLISDMSSFTTGSTVFVDGGILLMHPSMPKDDAMNAII